MCLAADVVDLESLGLFFLVILVIDYVCSGIQSTPSRLIEYLLVDFHFHFFFVFFQRGWFSVVLRSPVCFYSTLIFHF